MKKNRKPHIRKHFVGWCCRIPGDNLVVGYGMSPQEAYQKWGWWLSAVVKTYQKKRHG